MSLRRIGVLTGLELRQRVRRPGFYVLLGVFFLVVVGITWLGSLIFSGDSYLPSGVASVALYGVLLMVVLVTPTFTGNAINGERDAATLAPVQVTLATTTEILLAKLLAGWTTGLVYLVVALPALIFAFARGAGRPEGVTMIADGSAGSVGQSIGTLAVALVILIVEIGIVSAIGVGLSAVIARPLFSVAATYLIVMLLVLGTLIAFALGTLAFRTPASLMTESPSEVYVETGTADALPSCDDAAAPCLADRPDLSETCVEVRGWSEFPRTDRVWWVLAANPFVVLADATPTIYDAYGYPADLFGQLKLGIRYAQQPPELEVVDWSDPCDGEPASAALGYEVSDDATSREIIESSTPSWFVGLGVQLILAAGLMLWGVARTRTPSRGTPPGSRIA